MKFLILNLTLLGVVIEAKTCYKCKMVDASKEQQSSTDNMPDVPDASTGTIGGNCFKVPLASSLNYGDFTTTCPIGCFSIAYTIESE